MRSLFFVFTVIASVLGFSPQVVFAQQSQQQTSDLLRNQLKQTGEDGAGYSTEGASNPLGFVSKIIKTVLSLLGLIFLVLTIYGGYLWMMARGDEKQVEKAKETIKAGVIGLAIMLSAYIISVNVLSYLLKATGQTPAPLGP